MVTSICETCGKEVARGGSKPARFCSKECMAVWQRTQKPVDREWLYQKYVVEKIGAYKIAKMVNRNAGQVRQWLIGYGIPIREKWQGNVPSGGKHQDEQWLRDEYGKGRSIAEIAELAEVVPATIFRYMKKFGLPTRSAAETLRLQGRTNGLSGIDNPMYGKRGVESSNWQGGVTPERQAFYSSIEWAEVVPVIWKRDEAACQRCGKKPVGKGNNDFHIHHIASFSVRHLRAEPSNLVLLCKECHTWVHSKANKAKLFIKEHEPTIDT